MAKIVIGGVDHVIPELNFMGLERAWPFVESAMVSGGSDPMVGPAAALRIISAGIMEDEQFQAQKYNVTATPDEPDKVHDQVYNYLRKKLKAKEMSLLKVCIMDILEEAGLVDQAGEALGVPKEETAELLSKATAPASSLSSSQPDAKVEVG